MRTYKHQDTFECPECRGTLVFRPAFRHYPYVCSRCKKTYKTEDVTPEEIPEETIQEAEIEEVVDEKVEVRQKSIISKEERKKDSELLKDFHYRLNYGSFLESFIPGVSVAYRWDWPTRIATVYFTVKSSRDQFSRPMARRVLIDHINKDTHMLEFECYLPNEKSFKSLLRQALAERLEEHPEEFPKNIVDLLRVEPNSHKKWDPDAYAASINSHKKWNPNGRVDPCDHLPCLNQCLGGS